MATPLTGGTGTGAAIVAAGMALGVVLMLGLDEFIPHEHPTAGAFGPAQERVNRVWLLVFAIALHNLPEGMAGGVGFSQGDLKVGMPLATAIGLQDIPEGLAVALALRVVNLSPLRAVPVAAATGVIEPIGAMIFVVSHEVIPETHRNGHQLPATIGLMGGFIVMMLLDTALG